MLSTLTWYLENIMGQVFQMLPCMSVDLILWSLVRPLRLRQLSRRGSISPRRREFGLLLFVLFCGGLCALTLFPYGFWRSCLDMVWHPGYGPHFDIPPLAESWERLLQLPQSITPFREILRVTQGGPWLWFVLWGNIGMFVPIGFCVPLLWRQKTWFHALVAGGLFSLLIETVQIFVGRVSDIDDVILNTAGSLLGFLFYCIACKVMPLKWHLFHCQKKEDS